MFPYSEFVFPRFQKVPTEKHKDKGQGCFYYLLMAYSKLLGIGQGFFSKFLWCSQSDDHP
jgi:hypothetical protein